jgi:hypothetical protein
MNADQWPDHVRLSDIEPKFFCTKCRQRGGEIRAEVRAGEDGDRWLMPLLQLMA